MKSAAPFYRKLPGRGLSFSGIGRMWLAEDHLLEVESLLISERYRRFFLKDIAAIVIRRTKVRLYWNLVHGAFWIGGSLIAAALWWGSKSVSDKTLIGVMQVFSGLLAPVVLIFLILFLINTLLGPTCRCHLQTTSAGWHPLAAPSRLRKARRVLAQLAPLIEAAQSAGGSGGMESTKSLKDPNEERPAEPVL